MIRRALFGMTALALITLGAPTYALADLVFQFSNTTQAGNNAALTDAYEGTGSISIYDVHNGHNAQATSAGVYPGKIATPGSPNQFSTLGSTSSNYYPGGVTIGFNTFCVDLANDVNFGQQYDVNNPLTPLSGANLTDVGPNNNGNVSESIGYLYDTYASANSFAWTGTMNATTAEEVQLAIWALLDSSLYTNLDTSHGSIANYTGSNAILVAAHNMYFAALGQKGNPVYGTDFQIVATGIQNFLVPNVANPNVPATPEPASFAVWAGFAGLGLVSLRRHRLLKLR